MLSKRVVGLASCIVMVLITLTLLTTTALKITDDAWSFTLNIFFLAYIFLPIALFTSSEETIKTEQSHQPCKHCTENSINCQCLCHYDDTPMKFNLNWRDKKEWFILALLILILVGVYTLDCIAYLDLTTVKFERVSYVCYPFIDFFNEHFLEHILSIHN